MAAIASQLNHLQRKCLFNITTKDMVKFRITCPLSGEAVGHILLKKEPVMQRAFPYHNVIMAGDTKSTCSVTVHPMNYAHVLLSFYHYHCYFLHHYFCIFDFAHILQAKLTGMMTIKPVKQPWRLWMNISHESWVFLHKARFKSKHVYIITCLIPAWNCNHMSGEIKLLIHP